ncbi:MAG: UvrD-helicase domain-containing protein [Alphaproteobacteria bacterium]|nr:UvrD-helicase domain-containing protein [Alphaproteobacteria bacterium]
MTTNQQGHILPDGSTLAITKDVTQQISRFMTMGGQRQKAAEKTREIIGAVLSIGRDAFNGFNMTHNGESRIKHCIKYDLNDGCRLVTIQQDKVILFAYLGDHDDATKWLNSHAGVDLVQLHSGQAKLLRHNASKAANQDYSPPPDIREETLFRKLKEESFDYLTGKIGPSARKTIKKLEELTNYSPDTAILNSVEEIKDDKISTFIVDVMSLLQRGDIESAEERISLERGDIKLVSELSDDETLKILDGEHIKFIRIGSPDYQKLWTEKANSRNFLDWFFFMHPEQERQVQADFEGPATLSGVSGSGKTCIAIKRAIRLAEDGPNDNVLVITLNRSLSSMIEKLIDSVSIKNETRQRIHVTSLFQFLQKILIEQRPNSTRHFNDETWIPANGKCSSPEHVDEVFREYYRCETRNNDASVLLNLHRSLVAQGIDAEQYIREEFDWIRSALSENSREEYLKIERSGRKYPIIANRRQSVLEGLTGWEKKMRAIGIIDYLGLTSAATEIIDSIKPIYDHIIIDEAQDFGTTELRILRHVTKSGPNDIYLCGDLAQHILPKKQLLREAGIDISNRKNHITKNYRNTREILKAAYRLLYDNLDEGSIEAGELSIQDPDLSNATGQKPLLLNAPDLAVEFDCARQIANSHAQDGRTSCIVFVGYSLLEVRRFGKKVNLPVLDGTTNFLNSKIVLSDLEQSKGYEFDLVFILNASGETVPPAYIPQEEVFRFGSQLYVAMTRAKQQLFISYSGETSKWFASCIEEELIVPDAWEGYVDRLLEPHDWVTPQKMYEFSDSEGPLTLITELTGQQFNYTPHARNLSLSALEKLEDLIDGYGRTMAGSNRRVKWKNIGHYYQDATGGKDSFQAKILTGEKTLGEIKERLDKIVPDELRYRQLLEESARQDAIENKASENDEKTECAVRMTPGIEWALKQKVKINYLPTKIHQGKQIAIEHGIAERTVNDGYWILYDNDNDLISLALEKLGYYYIKGKGWKAS